MDCNDRLRKYELAGRQELKEMSLRLDTELTALSIGGICTDYGREGWPQFIDISINGERTYYIYVLRFMAEKILTRAKKVKKKLDEGVKLNAGGSIQYIFGLY